MNTFYAIIIGLFGGIASGLFGVGGGVVMVPAMLFLLTVRDIKQAIGTSLAVIIPTAFVGTLRHYQANDVDWRLALSLTPGAVVGGVIGVWLATQLPAENLKRAFGGFLVLVGCRLLFSK